MRIIHGVREFQSARGEPFRSAALTIGNFDGVHLGHQALLKRVVERAKEKNLVSAVMTFEPHPVKVLYPDRNLRRIFDFDDQVAQMERFGVDELVIEPFSREFSQLPPERYVREWIYRPFVPETVVVGYDFTFGANRQGSIDSLCEQASALGFRVEVIPPVKVGDVLVSSSRIRAALAAGDVELAAGLLGRRFYLRGLVVRGVGRGRKIGIPTANLHTSAETLPAIGVYAAWATVMSGSNRKKFRAAVNVGHNPTFTEGHGPALSIEAHLIDFPGPGDRTELYGVNLRLDFVRRLRDEKKFSSVNELVEQIRKDVAVAAGLPAEDDE